MPYVVGIVLSVCVALFARRGIRSLPGVLSVSRMTLESQLALPGHKTRARQLTYARPIQCSSPNVSHGT